jgi:hypothetical protein
MLRWPRGPFCASADFTTAEVAAAANPSLNANLRLMFCIVVPSYLICEATRVRHMTLVSALDANLRCKRSIRHADQIAKLAALRNE